MHAGIAQPRSGCGEVFGRLFRLANPVALAPIVPLDYAAANKSLTV